MVLFLCRPICSIIIAFRIENKQCMSSSLLLLFENRAQLPSNSLIVSVSSNETVSHITPEQK